MMKTALTSILFLFVCLPAVDAQSFLKFSEPGWDFGKRDQTQDASKVIQVTNNGTRAVHVKKIELTCGCIEATLDKMVIQPKETVNLNLHLIAKRGEGEVKKFVIIHSDDPYTPQAKLPMTGFIQPIWWLSLKGLVLDFGEVENGSSTTKRVSVMVRPGTKLELVDVLFDPSDGQIKIKKTPFKNKDGVHGWHLDVALGGRLSTGDFEGIVRIETDYAPFRFRGFRVMGRVVTATEVSPQVLRLPTLKVGETWTGEIVVTKKRGTGMRVATVFCKDPRVSLKSEVIKEGQSSRVAVSITPKAGDKEIRGVIQIGIDEPGYHMFEVKYRGRVSAK